MVVHSLVGVVLAFAAPGVHSRGAPRDTISQAGSASITGVVIDSTGRSIQGASVLLDGSPARVTDNFGSFGLDVSADKQHVITVRALGFRPASFPIQLRSGATASVEIPVSQAASVLPSLDRVIVNGRAPAARSDPGVAGFEHRRATLGGGFFDAADIRKRGVPPLTMLLRGVPGVALHPVTGDDGVTRYIPVMRGVSTLSKCAVKVYLDGQPYDLGPHDDYDHIVSSHELAAVEVYPAGAWSPLQFSSATSNCGTIVLWTRSRAGN